jgi:hypothetical protein
MLGKVKGRTWIRQQIILRIVLLPGVVQSANELGILVL